MDSPRCRVADLFTNGHCPPDQAVIEIGRRFAQPALARPVATDQLEAIFAAGGRA